MEIDTVGLMGQIERTFRIQISGEEAEAANGSFDSVLQLISRCKEPNAAQLRPTTITSILTELP